MKRRMVPKKMYPPKAPDYVPAIAEVRWTDAGADNSGWQPIAYYQNGCDFPAVTCGYLIQDDEDGIRLLQTIAPVDGKGTEHIFIPRNMIKSLTFLKKPRKFVK